MHGSALHISNANAVYVRTAVAISWAVRGDAKHVETARAVWMQQMRFFGAPTVGCHAILSALPTAMVSYGVCGR
jgi:hypothetical protein